MRVVIGIPCLLRGGTETQTLQLVRVLIQGREPQRAAQAGLKRQNPLEVEILCYFESDPQVVQEFAQAGANVLLLKENRSISPWRFITTVSRAFRQLAPDLIHIQYMAPGFLAVVAARISGCDQVVGTVHQPWTPDHHGYIAKGLLRLSARMCKRFTCVSEAAEHSWFGSYQVSESAPGCLGDKQGLPCRHVTMYNAIDLSKIDKTLNSSSREEFKRRLGLNECVVIGTVARLSHVKGVDILLSAFAVARDLIKKEGGGPDVDRSQHSQLRERRRSVLIVVGDGEQRGELREQATMLGLRSVDVTCHEVSARLPPLAGDVDLIWFGRRTWEESIRLMSIFDVCVVPSIFEGFGLTAAEGMACNKAVVAAKVGGLPEVLGVDGSSGVLFPSRDVEGLARALTELALSDDRRLRIGEAARIRVQQKFGLEQFERSVRQLYALPNW